MDPIPSAIDSRRDDGAGGTAPAPAISITRSVPPPAFEHAFTAMRDVTEQRVRGLFNRHRATFAGFLVSALLPDSTVEVDPSWAWNVTWRTKPSPVRIDVRCSGEVLAHNPPGKLARAEWKVERPTKAWDPSSGRMRPVTHRHCDVIVLARHVGDDIEDGWTFRVASIDHLRDGWWRPEQLDALGIVEVAPAELPVALRAAAASPSKAR